MVVPFGPTLERHEVNIHLAQDILEHEAAGVLAWLVQGAVSWWQHFVKTDADPNLDTTGLHMSPGVEEATMCYAHSNDHVAGFIKERCQVGDGERVLASKLHKEYQRWRGKQDGVKRGALYSRILETPGVTKDERYFYGIAVLDDVVEPWMHHTGKSL